MRRPGCSVILLVGLAATTAAAQQRADTSYEPKLAEPTYPEGRGPVVLIDEGHHNFHTRTGRYAPFAKLLEADGYRVRSHAGPFSTDSLREARVLVIANALHERNARDWSLPTPSAFSDAEIEVITGFVDTGGSLLLIADHMPFPGAAAKLAARFGVEFENGFELDETADGGFRAAVTVFRRDPVGIADHEITRGRRPSERIEQVASFTGSAFRVKAEAAPLLVLGKAAVVLSPQRAWRFEESTPRRRGEGWLQGAALERGKGRVVVFGEAAMLTSQTTGPGRKTGLGTAEAKDNEQLVRNTLWWLAAAGKPSGESGSE